MLGSRSRLTDEADLLIENGALTLRAVKRPPREGWAEASRKIAAASDDKPVWPEFGNMGDQKLKW